MKNCFSTFSINLLFVTFFLINTFSFSQAQVKKGFKFGPELLTSLAEETGSFSRSFGYSFGVFTAIKLKTYENSSLLLRTELNFTRFQYHNPASKHYGVNKSAEGWNGLDYAVIDEKVWFRTFEFGLFPEYQFAVDKDILIEIFLGPSIGIGGKEFSTKQLDNNKFITDPYDEFTMGFILSPSLNLGFSIYYSLVVLNINYRYTNFFISSNDKIEFNNLFAQIGFAFN
jgi:hypothetical protein